MDSNDIRDCARNCVCIACAAAVPLVSTARAFHAAGCDWAPRGERVEHCQKVKAWQAAEDIIDGFSSSLSTT